jgi:hypothetical protein
MLFAWIGLVSILCINMQHQQVSNTTLELIFDLQMFDIWAADDPDGAVHCHRSLPPPHRDHRHPGQPSFLLFFRIRIQAFLVIPDRDLDPGFFISENYKKLQL